MLDQCHQRVLTHDVEFTLHSRSAGLRGSPLEPPHLPDLREAHRALLGGANTIESTHELVSKDTDRLTNSLETLAGETDAPMLLNATSTPVRSVASLARPSI